jgi:hypothetical protein
MREFCFPHIKICADRCRKEHFRPSIWAFPQLRVNCPLVRGDLPRYDAAALPSLKNASTAAVSGSSSAARSAPNGAFQNGPVRSFHGPT